MDSALQKTIAYIEHHLQEELPLEIIAREAGYSKFHFHRLFQREFGMSASEYVRTRRIADAAKMLLYTDEKILDIALSYQFDSQESFTRAFKKIYRLPPGTYRKIMASLTMQKEEISMGNQGVKGWFLSGSHPFNYEMGLDRKVYHSGKSSGYLAAKSVQHQGEFATMMQEIKADKYKGERYKFSGFIRAEHLDGFCGLWMRVDNALQDVLRFDNMGDRPITKDTEWHYCSIVLDIPEEGAVISIGALLSGAGRMWVDELKFEEVDETVPTTNIEFTSHLHDEPANLSFEEELG
ncbi:helix-turn-helix transcriptional regulator [Metabacillus indicus]|uniref:Transcriptional regulator n=1 Tax=Metabacillus indicus TaxID=246786 RepID=A0A084GJR5_METID|nr:AraC family transcriptional regulator [Metabacillus indicus]KEZ47577.1 transcriptional regulator [Metabacillus indicus]